MKIFISLDGEKQYFLPEVTVDNFKESMDSAILSKFEDLDKIDKANPNFKEGIDTPSWFVDVDLTTPSGLKGRSLASTSISFTDNIDCGGTKGSWCAK